MLWHILRIAYYAVWLVLLIHCIKRQRFFPILGPGLYTKILWLFTFVFFNPLLTLVYLVFGVVLKPPGEDRRRPWHAWGAGLALVLVVGILWLFEMPGRGRRSDPVTVGQSLDESKSEDTWPVGQAHAGVLRANNNLSTSTFSSHSQNARFAVGSVAIFCEEDHLLLDCVARRLQQGLSEQEMIHSVTYFPAGHELSGQSRLPDVFITLSLGHIDQARSPLGLKLNATVICQAGTSLYQGRSYTHTSDSPPRLTFGLTSRLEHRSEYIGIESRSLRYAQQAQDMAQQFHKALVDQFRKWRDEHGLMPDLPDFLYGESVPAPEFPFLQGDHCRKVLSGCALLTQNATTWTFTDNRPTLEVLKECRDHLRHLGFSGGDRLDADTEHPPEDLRMGRDSEVMVVFRRREQDLGPGTVRFDAAKPGTELSPSLPFVVHYTSVFTKEQRESALSQLLDSGTDLETVLIFEGQFHSPDLRTRLFDLLEKHPIQSMRGNLALARLYQQEDKTEKAVEAYMLARALARTERQHDPEANQFKSLAKQLGDASLAKCDVDLEYYRMAGFVDLTDVREEVSIDRGANEPAAFCVCTKDGDVTSVVLRLGSVAQQPAPPGQSPSYQLTKIIKTENSSSVGTNPLHPGMTSAYVQDYGELDIKIETLDTDRFRFTVRPMQIE